MPGTALFMRDVQLTLRLSSDTVGARTEFNCDLQLAAIETTAGDVVEFPVLCKDTNYSSVGKSTFALHIRAGQQWADGLAAFLWDNEGELLDFQYQAHGEDVVPTADAPGMSGQCRAIAGNYGGEVNAYALLEVTMPCTAKPTRIEAAFPTTAEAAA